MGLLAVKAALLPLVARIAQLREFAAVVPISAEKGTQLEALLAECIAHLPEGPPPMDPEMVTDRGERFFAAELLREKLFCLTGEEIPYTSTVVIDRYEETPRLRRICSLSSCAKNSATSTTVKPIGTTSQRALRSVKR